MAERITSLDEIQDPEGFLNAYYKAMDEAKGMRTELTKAKQDLETLRESTSDEEVGKWRARAVKTHAKSALEKAGLKDADRILKYMNLDGIDFDEDENLTGFEEKFNEVKSDFPELFDVKRRAAAVSADIHAKGDVAAKPDPVREAVRGAIS